MARTSADYNFKDIKNSYFAYKQPTTVTHTQYTGFIKELNKALIQFVLDGNRLKLPVGLGHIYVERYRPVERTYEQDGKRYIRRYAIDFNETMKLRREIHPDWTHADWKKIPVHERPFVPYDNTHTQGYVYKIVWRRKNAPIYVKAHQFIPNHLTFKGALAKVLKSNDINKPKYYDKPKIRYCKHDNGEGEERPSTNS